MTRKVYHLVWSEKFSGWSLKGTTLVWSKKETALDHARLFVRSKAPSQLLVHRKDGTIEYENTYGADPRRYPS